jgi:hypothetical protein
VIPREVFLVKVTARSRFLSRFRSARLPLTGAAVAAAALFAAGCGPSTTASSAPSSAPVSAPGTVASSAFATPPTAAASAATPTPSSAPSPVPTALSSPTPAAAPPVSRSGAAGCATSNLKASAGARQGTAGSTYTNIDFTNTGSRSCTLYGYPGVSLANSGGPIGASATHDSMRGRTLVTLAPGATANAVLQVTVAQNYPASTCSPDSSTFLLIYPPNQTEALDLPFKSTGCKNSAVKLLSISVVAPGR